MPLLEVSDDSQRLYKHTHVASIPIIGVCSSPNSCSSIRFNAADDFIFGFMRMRVKSAQKLHQSKNSACGPHIK